MTAKDPYKDSPYDASGMPLATTTADYDNVDEVAQATVKDKPVEFPESINDIDYEPAPIDPKLLRKIDPKKWNSAIEEDVNSGHPQVATIDFEEATLDNSDPEAVKAKADDAKPEDDTSFLDEKKEDTKK